MLAQVSLTPAESKKLVAKAIVRMEVMKKALAQGMVVMHPSSSSYFIYEEIMGERPRTNVWVTGVIVPRGTCIEMAALGGPRTLTPEGGGGGIHAPKKYAHAWVIKGGKASVGTPLGELLEQMGPSDVFVKGVNALDMEGNAGIMIGSAVEGGTIGLVTSAARQKGFTIILPAGLEKLIPTPIKEAAKLAIKRRIDYSTGLAVGIFPAEGIVVTEVKAIQILSGAEAIPIAAGGLGGAEGAVTLVIKGEKEQVTKAVKYVEQSKGARLPDVRVQNCHECPATSICSFPVGDKPWA